ncbi:hypothetical protein RGUI_3615 [Rhodovulum sp. P5]|uniref:hypothetical protein n=1 Tax=Rhodovulum sp. P5 TaxID=1564506 RepID=UPI0009C2922B|nr:hypothetical protein [Rhodovulum sp. P5]ARE41756.1 hypothetical protein RGUI_3615 [Rhodovulum sp. P5]
MPDGPDLASVLGVLGHEMGHAAELLRRYERAVLMNAGETTPARTGASELQLVDLVIQILEDLGPFSKALSETLPKDLTVPPEIIDGLRLDQLRCHLGGTTLRETPHSGGHIDFF